MRLFRLLTIFVFIFLFSGLFSSFNNVEAGDLRCKSGKCNTDADCYGARNGGVAICREDGKGYKECVNAYCPYGKTKAGANCDCTAGRFCGQTCNASVGLCADGISECAYRVGPNCRVSRVNVDETTYCIPLDRLTPEIKRFKCVARDQWNSYALYNGSNPTVAQIQQLCTNLVCSVIDPEPANLIYPADNAQVTAGPGNRVNLDYNVETGWGAGCPSTQKNYRVEYSKNCTNTYISANQQTSLTGLTVGSTYCWRVFKNNGGGLSYSPTYRFTVVEDSTEVTSAGIAADVCKSGFSGISGSSLVTNPVDFNVNFTTAATNKYNEVWFAMVPAANDSFNDQAGIPVTYRESADTANILLLKKVVNANAFAAKITLNASNNPVQAWVYNQNDQWGSVNTFGQSLSGLGATLMDFGSNSTAQVSGTSLSARFRIRFDNVPLGKYNFYVAAVITDQAGNKKTSYSTASDSFVYKKVAISTASAVYPSWGVDLVAPTADAAFLQPIYQSSSQFQVNWKFKEINGLQLKSFIGRDSADSNLSDTTTNPAQQIDFTPQLPDVDKFNTGNLQLNDVSSNGFVTQSNLGIRAYQDSDANKQTSYQFYAFAKDNACNQQVITAAASLQKPWLIGYGGDVSAAQGISFSLPSGLNEFSDALKVNSGASVLTDKQSVFLSTYSAISGTVDMPIRKQSKTSQFLRNYNDLSIKPPISSGQQKWFDYIYELVKKNNAASITNSESVSFSGNTSSLAAVSAGQKGHVYINRDLKVENARCDSQSIIFVNGNLTIIPNFTVADNNGCIFVVSGNISVENGAAATNGININDSTLSNYDLIEAALFSDGQFITYADNQSNTLKWDGLMLKGSLTSENVNLQRDINLNANQFQPAHVFYFDARYREIFKTDLSFNEYSIREVGFAN